ncbi:MAG: V-type ATP synthase subunit A [Chloroflexota bacterium]|nr:V-type ATP synthase subunit A [Chloroflexota bacterium]
MRGKIGAVIWINGPVVRARRSNQVGMLEVVEIGEDRLVGEVIGLEGEIMTIQVYEETSGLHPGAPVYGTGMPLSVELGPGLLGSVFDGIQRPLPVLESHSGSFLGRGIKLTPLYREDLWAFKPKAQVGDQAAGGTLLGSVPETELIEHQVMVPPDTGGELSWIAPEGEYKIDEPIARLKTDGDERELTMLQRWPVRRPRPYADRLEPQMPLITGQRVLDTLFPQAKGGASAIPGGFGAGKTILQQQIAKWSDADVVVYVGCGERGNEMTDVLRTFPQLTDPHSGRPLMERTVLIANTSNMPVAAREASIYTSVTIAEYYRDMGYHVALMADSTSRWAEAMREISGRLEEMPAEEGYPAYLAARLAEFYERAGYVHASNGREGSVTIIGAVSPPGGDFSEPVTQHTKRFVRCFWALDRELAYARHFPAVSWRESYSEYVDDLEDWWRERVDQDWHSMREQAMGILSRESHLQDIVQLVGPDALPDDQRLILETARLLREGFLQQNALDEVDTYSTAEKQIQMLELILHFHERASALIKLGCPIVLVQELPVINAIRRIGPTVPNDELDEIEKMREGMDEQMDKLEQDYQ